MVRWPIPNAKSPFPYSRKGVANPRKVKILRDSSVPMLARPLRSWHEAIGRPRVIRLGVIHRPDEWIEEATGDSHDAADYVGKGNGDKSSGGAIDEQRRPGGKLEADFRRKALRADKAMR